MLDWSETDTDRRYNEGKTLLTLGSLGHKIETVDDTVTENRCFFLMVS